ncbi:MAG: hypothetical protein ACI9ES_000999 [Oceanospirillaceae bacterium]|jgi:uncharacterized protein (UPF0210 family)
MQKVWPLNYTNSELCKVRTITTFITLTADRETWQSEITKAAQLCTQLASKCQEKNYQVQSIRIVTNAFGEYLSLESLTTAREGLNYLSELLHQTNQSGLRVRFAIGEAKTAAEIALLPQLISEFGDLCNACVNVPIDQYCVLDNELILECAKAVKQISKITARGEGNFNFTVNFNCAPHIPYFPASYHDKSIANSFVIGLETPDLLVHALQSVILKVGQTHREVTKDYFIAMSTALQYHIAEIAKIVDHSELDSGWYFAGFDSSAAPSKDCASMAQIYQLLGVPYFGASGTVEASALLTKVFKSITDVDLVGFSGLMLALTEDRGLAQGSIDDQFDIRSLLTYSAVCGIGLDTVPIPGDTTIDKMAALMRDTGTMAFRLNKPLTVRVFPVPGLSAGEMTAFESDDLCNCKVLAVP